MSEMLQSDHKFPLHQRLPFTNGSDTMLKRIVELVTSSAPALRGLNQWNPPKANILDWDSHKSHWCYTSTNWLWASLQKRSTWAYYHHNFWSDLLFWETAILVSVIKWKLTSAREFSFAFKYTEWVTRWRVILDTLSIWSTLWLTVDVGFLPVK